MGVFCVYGNKNISCYKKIHEDTNEKDYSKFENTVIPYVMENSNAEKVDKSYDWSVEIKYGKGSPKEVAVYVVNSNSKEPEFINKILEYIKQYK